MELQVLDIDYYSDEGSGQGAADGDDEGLHGRPIIRIFGGDETGKRRCIEVRGFEPYFYVLPRPDLFDTIKDLIEGMKSAGVERVEDVLRYKPVGYQSQKTRMLKVVTISPKNVKPLREEILKNEGVLEIYEADILFHNRFAADMNITGMSWVRADGNVVDCSGVHRVEREDNIGLRVLSFDIEVLTPEDGSFPSADKDEIIFMSMAFSEPYHGVQNLVLVAKDVTCPRPDIITLKNERELLLRFQRIIREFDPDVITGYNIAEFDGPYIGERMRKLCMSCNVGRDGSGWEIRDVAGRKEIRVAGRVVVDTLVMIRKNFSLPRYNLKTVAAELLRMEKLDVPASRMREYWFGNSEQFAEFVRYSRRDAVLALKLMTDLGMLEKYIALSRTTGILLQDAISGGQSVMLEFMLLQRYGKIDRVMGMKPELREEDEDVQYEGAYVSEPEVGVHEHLILTDMQSLYPSIVISKNLCPTTVIKNEDCREVHVAPNGGRFLDREVAVGVLPQMLDEVLQKRLAIKKKMKSADERERAVLDAIQYSLKIVINSAYGWMGYKRSRLFDLTTASAVTAYGREIISGVRESFENLKDVEVNGKRFDFHVVYTDTDSAYVKLICKNSSAITLEDADAVGMKVAAMISEPMPYPMRLNYEGYARRALFLAKKRYAMLIQEKDKNGNIKEKLKVRGIEMVRRDWCPLIGKTMRRCLEMILKDGDVDGAYAYANDIINKVREFRLGEGDQSLLEDLVLTRNFSKKPEAFKAKPAHIRMIERMEKRGEQLPGIGDRISFYIMDGWEDFSERAETLDYIMKKGRGIDTDYYVEKQIAPPLSRLFAALGIDIDVKSGRRIAHECDLSQFFA